MNGVKTVHEMTALLPAYAADNSVIRRIAKAHDQWETPLRLLTRELSRAGFPSSGGG